MNKPLIIAAIAVLGVSAAYAGGLMKNADGDGDGYVSLEELKAAHTTRIEKHFAEADTDGDGLLSEAERRAAHKQMRDRHQERRQHMRELRTDPEHIVEHLDTDGSGSVSRDEFAGRRFTPDDEAFYAADTDGNGELDALELGELMAARHAERRTGKDRPKRD